MAADDQFRRQLDQALDRWVLEEFIEPDQRDRLRDYYQLDQLSASATGRFTMVLLSIGAVLVGLGIITFIAANWVIIPRSVRAIGALGIMIGFQVAGFRQWRSATTPGDHRLAGLLLLIGEMAMGASIGLMAQWVQVSGSPAGLFLVWGLGILSMAYGIRHTPSGILALILILTGFVVNVFSYGNLPLLNPALFPWVTLIALLPLAYWCRSRWIWTGGILAYATAMQGLAIFAEKDEWWYWFDLDWPNFYALTLAHGIGVSSVWIWSLCHQARIPRPLFQWIAPFVPSEPRRDQDLDEASIGLDFAPIGQFLALVGLAISLYLWSFRWIWFGFSREAGYDGFFRQQGTWRVIQQLLTQPAGWSWILLAGLTGILWFLYLKARLQTGSEHPQQWQGLMIDVAIGIGGLGLILLPQFGSLWGISLLVTNLLLLGLGSLLCWQGLQLAQRWRFWLGLLTLTLEILTRFFEYETGLLLKSIALIGCGILVILTGLRFERYLATRRFR